AARTACRRRRCAEARPHAGPEGWRPDRRGRTLVDRGRLCRRSRGLPGRARAPRARMIRPGVTFVLWLAIAVLLLVNNLIGDTWIADRLPVLSVEWYKVLVPLPY